MSRSWIYELLARDRSEGPAAFVPRSRRPKTSPRATPPETVELVLELRKHLAEQGLDAGPDTICWHLAHHHAPRLSRATIHRLLADIEAEPGCGPSSGRAWHCLTGQGVPRRAHLRSRDQLGALCGVPLGSVPYDFAIYAGRSFVGPLVLGPPEQVARRAPCPVLTVPGAHAPRAAPPRHRR